MPQYLCLYFAIPVILHLIGVHCLMCISLNQSCSNFSYVLLGSWPVFAFFSIFFSCSLEESEPGFFCQMGWENLGGRKCRGGPCWGNQNFKGCIQIPQCKKKGTTLLNVGPSAALARPKFQFHLFSFTPPLWWPTEVKQLGKIGYFKATTLGKDPF